MAKWLWDDPNGVKVQFGGIDYDKWTAEDLAKHINEGVPVTQLRKLSESLADTAAGQAVLQKAVHAAFAAGVKAVAGGANPASLLTGILGK